MMTDPIADMLTRIRNGYMAHKKDVEIPFSTLKVRVLDILKREGYISDYDVKSEVFPAHIVVALKYHGRRPAITAITRESTPGHRIYCKAAEMPVVLNGYGMAIISTPKGLMTNVEAKKQNLGGEILCSVS